jgi:L-ascorbate metabolism protein UlaG (beta-lactamase superfamily)
MHPLTKTAVPAGNIAIHWFEQSTFALKDSSGSVVQVDPYYPRKRPAERYIHAAPPLDESTLPTDYILLTHAHGDHTCSESIERIREAFPDVQVVGPQESIAQVLAETGVDESRTQVVEAGDTASLGSMKAHAVYAKPPTGDPDADIGPPDVTHLGFVVEADGVSVYFSGDPINTFGDHEALVGAVADLDPDIGFLTNHPTEGEFPFFEGSVDMAFGIGLTHVGPAHYQCFVTRNYDPSKWAAQFPDEGPRPIVIPHNSHIVYPSGL